MKREYIYEILRLALSGDRTGLSAFEKMSPMDWEWAFSTLNIHGMSAFAYDAVERLPQDMRPPKEVLFKFISANIAGQQSYAKIRSLVDKIGAVIRSGGVKCLLLKGLSLAEYYRRPESRKFVDVDLYAPGAESRVDGLFRDMGVEVDADFYRHSHMTLSGILVENHYCLLDAKGRRRLKILDADLKSMALKHLEHFEGPGLYHPDAMFSLIFNLHHAMSHFIYEGISFKFLVDWILFLRKESGLMCSDQAMQSLKKHGLMKFAAVMTDVSVRHLGLSLCEVPEYMRSEMDTLENNVVERFIDDLFRPYEKIHYSNIVAERLHCVRRIIRASWKPKVFLGQNAFCFVWNKFLPILMGRKYEAD